MITSQEEQELSIFLLRLAELEEAIEKERNKLASIRYDPFQLFLSISTNQQFIDEILLMEIFKSSRIFSTSQEVKGIIQFFDPTGKGVLEYSEFVNMILPNDDSGRTLHKCVCGKGDLAEMSYKLFISILEKELLLTREYISFFSQPTIDAVGTYEMIEKKRRAHGFNSAELKKFMNQNGLVVTDEDLRSIMRRLDTDKDGVVSLADWNKILQRPREAMRGYTSRCSSTLQESKSGDLRSGYRQINPYECRVPRNGTQGRGMCRNLSNLGPMMSEKRSNKIGDKIGSNNYSQRASSSNKFKSSERKYGNDYQKFPKLYSKQNENDETFFVDFLKLILDTENHYENLKCELSIQNDFNLEQLFDSFDNDHNSKLFPSDIINGLSAFNIFPTQDESTLFIRKFDPNMLGYLTFESFCENMYPLNRELRNKLIVKQRLNKDRDWYINGAMSGETELMIGKFFNAIISGEWRIESEREKISEECRFMIMEIFKKIDKRNTKCLSENDIEEYLGVWGVKLKERDMCVLLSRFDKDMDGVVGYKEFMEQVTSQL